MDAGAIEDLMMPATYGRHLARLFPVDKLLASTGLTAADFAERDRRITVRQALQYISNTLDLADAPDWYMAWAGNIAEHFHGPVSFALMSSPTLGDGLDAFVRYFPARIPYMHMQGRRDGEEFYAELCPLIELGAARALLVETPLLVLQQYLATVYGVDFSGARIELDYPAPAYVASYARYFKAPVAFNAVRNALVMPAAWRELRNLDYHESTWSHALRQCEALASSPERTTLGEVRNYLCRAFELEERRRALPTLDEVANALHLAPRTLIRRLRRLGTTYQAIMDEFLRTRAAELLANDRVKIKEVAAALGFHNPANFGKAFKRWYGVSPGGYRARHDHPAP
ncbi:MAG: AraC family transcriptional regulator ligand-binding domain-containing protein [Proteobacteria bacterium]|nr:AraC family transcriptional regulator ligand-binding domain-containing protein [Pseudomonadota bacterium]